MPNFGAARLAPSKAKVSFTPDGGTPSTQSEKISGDVKHSVP